MALNDVNSSVVYNDTAGTTSYSGQSFTVNGNAGNAVYLFAFFCSGSTSGVEGFSSITLGGVAPDFLDFSINNLRNWCAVARWDNVSSGSKAVALTMNRYQRGGGVIAWEIDGYGSQKDPIFIGTGTSDTGWSPTRTTTIADSWLVGSGSPRADGGVTVSGGGTAVKSFSTGVDATKDCDAMVAYEAVPTPATESFDLDWTNVNRFSGFEMVIEPAVASGITGSGALTPGGVTIASTGERSVAGAGALALGGVRLDASGNREVIGAGALTMRGPQLDASGEREIPASGALAVGGAALDGSGGLTGNISGSGALAAGPAKLDASGERQITGAAALSPGGAQLDAAGEREVTGAAALAMGPAALASAGSVSGAIGGSGALSVGAVKLDASGERSILGTVALTLGGAMLDGAGGLSGNIVGSGALTMGGVRLASTGERNISGIGSLTVGAALLSGTAIGGIVPVPPGTLAIIGTPAARATIIGSPAARLQITGDP
ncbi:hypothetical protein [Roseovarius pacificus]|uniref:hypothetical protein n=1 Tax=Roseovarius pacificus TaxID=337701 RepID=UPI00403A312A